GHDHGAHDHSAHHDSTHHDSAHGHGAHDGGAHDHNSAHDHGAHHEGAHAHDAHAHHSPAMFRDRFWFSLLLSLPILYFSEQIQAWFGYRAIGFAGSEWVNPVLGTVLFLYGGLVFLQGA